MKPSKYLQEKKEYIERLINKINAEQTSTATGRAMNNSEVHLLEEEIKILDEISGIEGFFFENELFISNPAAYRKYLSLELSNQIIHYKALNGIEKTHKYDEKINELIKEKKRIYETEIDKLYLENQSKYRDIKETLGKYKINNPASNRDIVIYKMMENPLTYFELFEDLNHIKSSHLNQKKKELILPSTTSNLFRNRLPKINIKEKESYTQKEYENIVEKLKEEQATFFFNVMDPFNEYDYKKYYEIAIAPLEDVQRYKKFFDEFNTLIASDKLAQFNIQYRKYKRLNNKLIPTPKIVHEKIRLKTELSKLYKEETEEVTQKITDKYIKLLSCFNLTFDSSTITPNTLLSVRKYIRKFIRIYCNDVNIMIDEINKIITELTNTNQIYEQKIETITKKMGESVNIDLKGDEDFNLNPSDCITIFKRLFCIKTINELINDTEIIIQEINLNESNTKEKGIK